jgi:PAS domain S-box-containing protein
MAAVNLIGSYNYWLVALSVLIAMFASYAALDLAGRVTAAGGWTRALWLLGGAGAMGTGIWSMHYIGMLAFILPVPVAYHWPTVLLSLLAAILASVVALGVVSRQKMGWFRALTGSVLMGAGIASMHYIGMAAMRLSALCQFSSFLVILSVVFAVLISLAALWITFHFRDEKMGVGGKKLAGAVVMGAAIPVMHYTGMAAASFAPSGMPMDTFHAVGISTLGTAGIAAVTFNVLGLALLTSWVDRRFAARTLEVQEEKLQQSQAYLAEAQRLTHTGSWAWRVAGGKATHLSEEWYRIYGFDPEEGLSAWEKRLQRMHPEDRDKWQEITNRAIREKSNYEGEHRILLPDGTVKHTHTVGHPVLNASGDVVEFVGTMMDVTERKRADEALLRSEGYLAEAQRLTRTGSWAWNVATRRSVYWSEENYRLFGFDPEGGIPSDEAFYERVHPEDRDRVRKAVFLEKPNEGSHFDIEFRIVLPGGEIKYVRSTGHPVRNQSGDLLEYVGTSVDVTERKRVDQERERLRQLQADLARVTRVTTMGELTASLAHEVNQPIAAASTNANTCLRWLAGDTPNIEEARAAAMRIVKDGKRAAEIMSRIRHVFKKGTSERELVEVNEIIREMIVLLRGEITRYNITVVTDLAEDLPQVMADRVQLQQVLMNLVINGIEAMKDTDGTRKLAITSQRTENEKVVVSITDSGVGLPPQQAEQIFNAFFTTKPDGTGMGLRISRSIIESHGGRLWAADNSPRGASFYFNLPTKVETQE